MLDSKCFLLLKTFSKEEWNRFGDFLRSPYFNKSAKIIELYEHLFPHFPIEVQDEEEDKKAREQALSNEELHLKLFPDKKLGGSNLPVLLTHFSKQIENFWIQEKQGKETPKQQVALLEELLNREGLEDIFKKKWQAIYKEEELFAESVERHHHKFQLENLLMLHLMRTEGRQNQSNLSETISALVENFLCEYLRYSLEALNRKNLLNETHSLPLLSAILSYLEGEKSQTHTALLLLYEAAVRCFLEPDNPIYYKILRQKLSELSPKISPSEALQLYQATINYLIRKNRITGDLLQEIFDCYREAEMQKVLYLDNGYLHPSLFISIVTTGLGLERMSKDEKERQSYRKWVYDFMARNEEFISLPQRVYTVAYTRAFILFSEKNFAQALKVLPDYNKDVISEITRRQLQLRIYYELGETELLAALAESSMKYLRRAVRISESKMAASLHFIQFVERLSKLKSLADAKLLAKVRKEMEQKEFLAHRAWLLQKLKELQ